MALKIRRAPRQLEPTTVDVVWPGDEAVDLEASDLRQWCRYGERRGLVFKEGVEPTVITIKPLSSRAVYECDLVAGRASLNFMDEAYRFGFVRADGIETHFNSSHGGVMGLDDKSLDLFATEKVPLSWSVCLEAYNAAREGRPYDEEKAKDNDNPMELTKAIGCHILALTFRTKQDDA